MIRTASLVVGIFASVLPAQTDPEPEKSGEAPDFQGLVSMMEEREAARKGETASVSLDMVTRGSYPGGVTFEITGTIRVLGETHTHAVHASRFEDDVAVEFEVVTAPEGSWVREKNPAFGELYYKIEPDLAAKIKAAQQVLGGDVGAAFAPANPVRDLRGAEMLKSFGEQFALESEPRTIKGRDFYVVSGELRGGAKPEGDPNVPMPDRVEFLVRKPDLAVVQMTQFKAGVELMQLKITRLELNVPMTADSFKVDLPDGARFIDVMDHPPAAAQIEEMLEAAERKKEGDGEKTTTRPDKGS